MVAIRLEIKLASAGRKTDTTPSIKISINAYISPRTADIEEDIRVKGTIATDFISFNCSI